jgi:hypothetical protein
MSVAQDAWDLFKTTIQADIVLAAYVEQWKLERIKHNDDVLVYPKLEAYVDRIERNTYVGVPKQRMDTMVISIIGKIKSALDDSVPDFETALIAYDEAICNALEKFITLSGGWNNAEYGDSLLTYVNDDYAQIQMELKLTLPRFTAGER